MAMSNAERQKRFRQRQAEKLARIKEPATNEDGEGAEMLDLIRAHFMAGATRAFNTIANAGQVLDARLEVQALHCIDADRPLSWIDVLNLAEAEGERRWSQHFERLAYEYMRARDASRVPSGESAIPTATKGRRRQ